MGPDPSRKGVIGLSHTEPCHRNCCRQGSGGLTLNWGVEISVNGALHWKGAQKTHRAIEGSGALCEACRTLWGHGGEAGRGLSPSEEECSCQGRQPLTLAGRPQGPLTLPRPQSRVCD